MIRCRFSVFEGVGPGREKSIIDAGITDWSGLLSAKEIPGVSESLLALIQEQAREWSDALQRKDERFFERNLARRNHWLLFETFKKATRYLDIETTGLSPRRHVVTMVGVYNGKRFKALVRGKNLSAASLREALVGCKLLVSYFGSQFDVPFLKHAFPEVSWDLPHFDLCFAARKVGLAGGLKRVERLLGMQREDEIADVDGFEAVRLWRRYERGDRQALKKLVDYNEADTRNLAPIAEAVYGRLCRQERCKSANRNS